MTKLPQRTPESFPPEVHASVAELYALARQATSRTDPILRWATPDEIALSEALRAPNACTATSARTGLACRQPRIKGGMVCKQHGGALRSVRRKANQRLADAVLPVLTSMRAAALQTENLNAAVKAGADLLDRANVGALVQSKVRASKRDTQTGPQVIVNVGFLG
jgi:hypothetical protein